MATYYDDALPKFAKLVVSHLGRDVLKTNVFLRDAVGRLTFVCVDGIDSAQAANLARAAFDQLQPYVDTPEFAVATPEMLLDQSLSDPSFASNETISHPEFEGTVRVVERRILGQDWLVSPCLAIDNAPPVFVFASLKGGVGRSTALAIAAVSLARRGDDVLVIDLDLEAPGIGAMLLSDERMPKNGALDYYVENGLRELDRQFFDDLIGVSDLTDGRGIIHVVPAIGSRSNENPQNVLAKLARAYLDDPTVDSEPKTFLTQTRDLISALCARRSYKAILVDARAGLNETTAASIQGLDAEVLLFGIDTPQTFQAYRLLLAHLARFRPDEPQVLDWRLRLRMVHAKAQPDPESAQLFRDQAFEVFADYIYDEADSEMDGALNFDLDDANAPHYAWRITADSNYLEFDPGRKASQLLPESAQAAFGSFLSMFHERLELLVS